MSEDPSHYGPNRHLHDKRLRTAAVLRAGADWLSHVDGYELPAVLDRLGPLVDELEAAMPQHARRWIPGVREAG